MARKHAPPAPRTAKSHFFIRFTLHSPLYRINLYSPRIPRGSRCTCIIYLTSPHPTSSARAHTSPPGANEGHGADLADGSVDSGWNFKASVYNRSAARCFWRAFCGRGAARLLPACSLAAMCSSRACLCPSSSVAHALVQGNPPSPPKNLLDLLACQLLHARVAQCHAAVALAACKIKTHPMFVILYHLLSRGFSARGKRVM